MASWQRAALRGTAAVTLGLGLLYAVLLVPALRPVEGGWPLVDVWLNMLVDAGVIAVVVLRGALDRRDRPAWLLLAAGLGTAFAASTAYFAWLADLDPIPSPSVADAGWLCFYLLLGAGLLQLLRARVRHLLRSAWLDGAIAGLTAAALADAFLEGAALPVGDGDVTRRRRALPAGRPAAARHRRGRPRGRWAARVVPSWWLLCSSFVVVRRHRRRLRGAGRRRHLLDGCPGRRRLAARPAAARRRRVVSLRDPASGATSRELRSSPCPASAPSPSWACSPPARRRR